MPIHLPEVLYDEVLGGIATLVQRMRSPVVDIDLSKATDQELQIGSPVKNERRDEQVLPQLLSRRTF